MLIVPKEINAALVTSSLMQGFVPSWTPQWNVEFGDLSSDIATHIAAKTKEPREAIAEKLVAVCPRAEDFVVTTTRGYLNITIRNPACLDRWSKAVLAPRTAIVLTHRTLNVSGLSYLRLGALSYIQHCLQSMNDKQRATIEVCGTAKQWKYLERSDFLDFVIVEAQAFSQKRLSKEEFKGFSEPITAWIASEDLRGSFQEGFASDLFRDGKVQVLSPSKSFFDSQQLTEPWKRAYEQYPNETIGYLALRGEPTNDLEVEIPSLNEGANIFWNLNFLVQRLQKLLSELSAVSVSKQEAPAAYLKPTIYDKYKSIVRTMLLWEGYLHEVAYKGAVVLWGQMLRALVENTHGVLNDPEFRSKGAKYGIPQDMAVLLSSVNTRLRDIISAITIR